MKYIFDIDLSRCVNCCACAVACMDQNDIFPEKGDMPLRRCFTVEQGQGMDVKMTYMSISCMHCADAPCISACPVGCIQKDRDTGFTIYDHTNCIGCHSCSLACPFAAPSFDRDGKMVKCNGCVTRVKHGLEPACVRVCPFDALKLYTEEEYMEVKKLNAAKSVAGKMNTQEI